MTANPTPPTTPTSSTRRLVLIAVAVAVVAVVLIAYLLGRSSSGSSATPTPAPATSTTTRPEAPTQPPPSSAAPTSSAVADPALAGAQQSLTKLGYYSGPIDGIDTPATRAAITAFQTWARTQPFGGSVTVTGMFDPPTQYALNEATGGNAYGPGGSASSSG